MPGEVSVSMTPESADDLPAPLVPAEVDLRHFVRFPFDSSFVNSPVFLLASGDQVKAHVALLCRAWGEVPAASLPSEDRVLALLSCAGTRWQKVKEAALTGFVLCSDGRYYHHGLAIRAVESWGRSLEQRKRAEKRWHGSANSVGNAVASTVAYATAIPRQCQEEKRGEEKGREEKGREGKGRERKPKVKSDGTAGAVPARPSLEDVKTYCRVRGNSVDPEKWFDHYTANGWRVGKNPMKDWQAAIRTWERNGVELDPEPVPPKPRSCARCGAIGSFVETGEGPLCMPCYRA